MFSVIVILLSTLMAGQAAQVTIKWDFNPQPVYEVELGDVVTMQYDSFHDVTFGPGCSGGMQVCGMTQGSGGQCQTVASQVGDFPFYCSLFGHCGQGMHSVLRVVPVGGGSTKRPTKVPTLAPTKRPTTAPSKRPTKTPTTAPTKRPTRATTAPTKRPTRVTKAPTAKPTKRPTEAPTKRPTRVTKSPTKRPTRVTKAPTVRPTKKQTV